MPELTIEVTVNGNFGTRSLEQKRTSLLSKYNGGVLIPVVSLYAILHDIMYCYTVGKAIEFQEKHLTSRNTGYVVGINSRRRTIEAMKVLISEMKGLSSDDLKIIGDFSKDLGLIAPPWPDPEDILNSLRKIVALNKKKTNAVGRPIDPVTNLTVDRLRSVWKAATGSEALTGEGNGSLGELINGIADLESIVVTPAGRPHDSSVSLSDNLGALRTTLFRRIRASTLHNLAYLDSQAIHSDLTFPKHGVYYIDDDTYWSRFEDLRI